jgi:hypothetical protein
MDPFAPLLEHLGHRMLSEPVDLQVRVPGPQFVGDGQVTADVAEPDRRPDVQRPLACTMAQEVNSTIVGSPVPNTS